MQRARTAKRPCGICRKWFMPDPRQIGRQKTCKNSDCRKEHHRRQCRQWNRKNREYFKANYLSEKLFHTKDPPAAKKRPAIVIPPSRIKIALPKDVIVNIIGAGPLVILEYVIEQIMHRAAAKSALRPP